MSVRLNEKWRNLHNVFIFPLQIQPMINLRQKTKHKKGVFMKTTQLLSIVLINLLAHNAWPASVSINNGTKLTAASDTATIQCINNYSAMVDISTTITSSGSVDSAEIRNSIDGNTPILTGWVDPQDFVHNGRFKTAVSSFTQVFNNGSHNYTSCYTQSGADGRISKQVCAPSVNFDVNCMPVDTCSGVEVFGNIIGNGNLCSGQTIPIHIKGSFGSGGTLIITKDTFSKTIQVDRSGESCVYQARYHPYLDGNNGAGNYTFTLIGDNGATYSFNAQLKCK